MNECFFIGKIVTDVNFDFIYNSKHISISRFNILVDNQIIIINAYDELADYTYRLLKKNDYVFVNGKISENGKIELSKIIKL